MEYYHQLITEKSWQILQQLRRKYQFILIGGWAVFLYSKSLKSKDIDIIIDYQELDKLKKEFSFSKNDRLKKYEIKIEETDIDIYLPFYSQIGLPIEEIQRHTQSYEGFGLPLLEAMACGVPVLTSDISSLPEVGGNAAYYVNPNNYQEIASGMQKILSDNKLIAKMSKMSLVQAAKFSWTQAARQTHKVYESLIKDQNAKK